MVRKRYLQKAVDMLLGLLLSAVGIVMMIQANIGLDSWSVFHQGISFVTGITIGTASMVVGATVIAIAIAMGSPFGIGTIVNIFGCGLLIDLLLWTGWIPLLHSFWPGVVMLLIGLELLALGTYFFIRSGMGNGPRDALMIVFLKKTKIPVGLVRGTIEVGVTICGWLMGGHLGIGTVIVALGMGLFLQITFQAFHFKAEIVHQESVVETFRNLRDAHTNA